jgi:hypothetical protein
MEPCGWTAHACPVQPVQWRRTASCHRMCCEPAQRTWPTCALRGVRPETPKLLIFRRRDMPASLGGVFASGKVSALQHHSTKLSCSWGGICTLRLLQHLLMRGAPLRLPCRGRHLLDMHLVCSRCGAGLQAALPRRRHGQQPRHALLRVRQQLHLRPQCTQVVRLDQSTVRCNIQHAQPTCTSRSTLKGAPCLSRSRPS